MGNVDVAFVFVWTLNILFFLSTLAMADIATDVNSTVLYNCSGTIIAGYATGEDCNELMPDYENYASQLPGSVNNVDTGSGIGFLDWISSVKNWVTTQGTVIKGFLSAPYTILSSIPALQDEKYQPFIFIIASFWFAIGILLLVAFIIGRLS